MSTSRQRKPGISLFLYTHIVNSEKKINQKEEFLYILSAPKKTCDMDTKTAREFSNITLTQFLLGTPLHSFESHNPTGSDKQDYYWSDGMRHIAEDI